MEVGLGPGDIVFDGDLASPRKGVQQPVLFGPCLLWPNGRPSQQLRSSFCTDHGTYFLSLSLSAVYKTKIAIQNVGLL